MNCGCKTLLSLILCSIFKRFNKLTTRFAFKKKHLLTEFQNMNNIIILHPENEEQEVALMALAKAFNIKFEISDKPYDPEFVAKIKTSEQQFEDGDYTRIQKDDLKKILDL